jgi:hypothetical protein
MDRQGGGEAEVQGKMGSAHVEQPENAKEEATLDYSEDGVSIPMKKDDVLEVTTTKKPSGEIVKEVVFKPQNDSKVDVSSVDAVANSGSSHKDMSFELDVIMKNSQFIMYVGLAFIAAGALAGWFLPNKRTGIILGVIGMGMLGAWVILPQIYANWFIVLGGLVIIIPAFWYYENTKNKRLLAASIEAHEDFQKENPEAAARHSEKFKEKIRPEDLSYVKDVRDTRKRKREKYS